MAILTADELGDYVYRRLGAPTLKVEVTADQMTDIIDDTIKDFSEFAYDGELEESVVLDINGKGIYNLPSPIQAVMRVSSGNASSLTNFSQKFGAGYVPNAWSSDYFSTSDLISNVIAYSNKQSLLDAFFGNELSYDFNSKKKILQIQEDYVGKVLVFYSSEYIPDATDYIYNENWVKRMTVAQARLIQSTTTGKFDQSLIGGASINYADMRSLALQEIEELKQDLQDNYAGPAPFLVL